MDTSDTSIVIQERRAADGLDSYIPMILQGGEITFSGAAAGLVDNPEVLRSYLGR